MSQTQDIANQVLAWRASGTPRRPFEGLHGNDVDTAYAVQAAVVAGLQARGEGALVGYKIALTSATMQAMCGVSHPLAGALLATRMHTAPHATALADHLRLGIECEVAVRLARALPVTGEVDREQVAHAVDACAPAFELVEDGQVDYSTLEANSLIADNCWNAGNVIGAWARAGAASWLDDNFTNGQTTLGVNGEDVDSGRIGDAMGHPFEAVAWVANLLASQGHALDAGMIVMTGSSVRTLFPESPCRLDFRAEGLGEVRLEVA